VGLAFVLSGIDRAFDAQPDCASLAFCERFVEREAHTQRRAPVPREAARETPSLDARERLEALAAALQRTERPIEFELPQRQLRELLDLILVATQPNWAYLGRKLVELDEAVERAAVSALSQAERAAFAAETERALERQRARADAPAHAASEARYLGRRARERFALPRVAGA